MRLTAFVILFATLHVSARSVAQKVSISGKGLSLKEILKTIKTQTGYEFIGDQALIEDAPKMNLDCRAAPLTTLLDSCLVRNGFAYEIVKKTIVITRAAAPVPLTSSPVITLPAALIHGRVTGKDGVPLSGATIRVKGTTHFTTSNAAGEFSINAQSGDRLLVTYVGYSDLLLKVDETTPATRLSVQLTVSSSPLDVVQIQAYGTTSKRLNTGDISTVTAADIQKQPVTNVLLALEGRVPGLFVSQNTGLPNSTVTLQIRGQNSIEQGKDPLYVVDGVPYTANMLPNAGTGGSSDASPFSFINPASIESVDVLKDADATAIYGSRAANGVILITTKKGKPGVAAFEFNVYDGLSEIPRETHLMNRDQYLSMRNEAFRNSGAIKTTTNAPDLIVWDTTRNIDWQKRLLGLITYNTDAQFAVSGGNSNSSYRLYGGYNINKPPFPRASGNYNSNKISGGVFLSNTSNDKRFNASVSVNYLIDNTFLPSYDPTANITLAPDAPEPFNADGSLNYNDYSTSNPFPGFYNTYKGRTNNLVSNISLGYKVLDNLQLKVTGGYNNMVVNGANANTIATQIGNPYIPNPTGSATFSYNTISSWIVEPQLTYKAQWGLGKLDALAGATFQQSTSNGQEVGGSGYTNDALLGSLAGATSVYNSGSTIGENRFTSLYSRINYNWADRYIVNLTGRRDGSSRFGPGRKFGNFGAAGVAWIFSNEHFIKDNLSFLSFGKLRGSYGTTGNEPAADYGYLSLNSFLYQGRSYQGSQAIAPDNLVYTDFAWEVVKKLEGGLELGFLKDRLLTSFSYFRNRTSNQLLQYQLPDITGFQTVYLNRRATVQNSGAEITFNTRNIVGSKFTWSTSLNFTVYRNKLVAFPGIEATPYSTTLIVGKPVSIKMTYRAAGVDPATGVYQFYDKNGKLTFTPGGDDYNNPVSTDPAFYGGFQNSFTYGHFSLDFLLSFVKQKGTNYVFRSYEAPGRSYYGDGNQSVELLNVWHKSGDKAKYQQYTSSYNNVANAYATEQYSDAAYTDASYMRLKNVSFSYQLPHELLKRIGLNGIRLYYQAQNLLTFTHYKGPDPEGQGYLPPLRIMTMGAQITF